MRFSEGMKVVSRILSIGMHGPDVRELHEKLELLTLFIPPEERKLSLFGPGTRKAVIDLQRTHLSYSRVTGIVDQVTVSLINSQAWPED